MSDQPRAYRAQYHLAPDGTWELCSVTTISKFSEDTEDTTRARVTSYQPGYGMIIARCLAYSFIEAATEFDDFRPESAL